jgi:hypothetical protein
MTRETPDLLDRLVIAIDRWQRRRLSIWEFSDDPECILRLGVATARIGAELADGTVVHPGDTVGIIHFWNARMPQIPPSGPDLAWARAFKHLLVHSLRLLACYLVENPTVAQFDAIGGELPFIYTRASIRMLRHLGFEVFDPVYPHSLAAQATDIGARLWTWLLRRAFNPESARGLRLSDLQRRPVWLSRCTFLSLYEPGDSTDHPRYNAGNLSSQLTATQTRR